MALQYFTGFEDGTTVSVVSQNTGFSNVATTPRSGNRCMSLPGSSDEFSIPFPSNLASAGDSCIVGFGIRFSDVSTGSGPFFAIHDNGNPAYVTLHSTGSGGFSARRNSSSAGGGNLLGNSSGSPLTNDTWHFFEVRVIFDDSVGQVEVYVDGTQEINLSGQDTQDSGTTGTSRAAHFRRHAGSTLVDDVYLLDPTGESAPYNTFLGSVEIERLEPDGDTTTTNWTSTGANFWDQLEEVPVTSTENVHTQSSGSPLLMTLENRTLTGSILAVKPHCIATLDAGVAATDLAPYMRADPGGTPTDSTKTGKALAVGDQEIFNIVLDDPDTAADWTDSGLNGAEIGFEVV